MKRQGFFSIPMVVIGLVLLGIALVEIVRSESVPRVDNDSHVEANGVRDWACPSGAAGRVTCSFVSVPEDYADPEIRSIELFVARIASPVESDRAPLIYMGSRIGDVSVQNFIEWQGVARQLQREIILVDERGSGRSQPRLACAELTQLSWLDADLAPRSLDTVSAERNDAVATCRARLDRLYPMEAYTFEALVNDLDNVRQLLAIDRWVLAAGGDGTFVARAYERAHPEQVEALVLFGASPVSTNRHVQRYDNGREVLAAALEAEGLTDTLEAAIAQLENQTIVFAINAGAATARVAVSAQTVRPTLARSAADSRTRASLESLVTERLTGGRWRGLAVARAQVYQVGGEWAAAMPLALACGEPSFAAAEPLWTAIEDFDTQWTALVDNVTLDPTVCDAWPAATYEALTEAPKARTLVVNGEYDIAAPRSDAEAWSAWSTVSASVVPQGGQPSPFDPCVVKLLTTFLGESSPTIPGTCV